MVNTSGLNRDQVFIETKIWISDYGYDQTRTSRPTPRRYHRRAGSEPDRSPFSVQDRDEIAAWVALHKRLRPLLHTGRVVRFDDIDPSLMVQAVYAADLSEAVISIAAIATADSAPIGRLVIPGLDPDATYHLELLPPGDVIQDEDAERRNGNNKYLPPWLVTGTDLTGAALTYAGVQLPEQLLLLHATRI